MTGANHFLSFPLHPRATVRLRLALALSAAFHLLFATAVMPEPPGGKGYSRAAALMTVRLAPQPVTATVGRALPEPEIPAARQARRPAAVPAHEPRATMDESAVRPMQDAPPLSLPQIPDLTYYGARELDAYPTPVAPLNLEQITDGSAAPGRVTLALLIDEHGVVNDVALTEPVAPDRLKEELRAVLAATRFIPARKDGRAVKSRVMLSVSFGQERREP